MLDSIHTSSLNTHNTKHAHSPPHIHSRLFTFAAARIVLAQLEGSGSRGALGAYNKAGFDALSSQLETKIEDADAWVEQLYQKSPEMGGSGRAVFVILRASG